MAAHDDKISDNRRRLFKALSAAPVVMTLRPGTAAASSAYQCLEKIRGAVEPNLLNPGPVPESVAAESPFKYAGPYDYWAIDPSASGCTMLDADVTFIVFVDPSYFDSNGNAVSTGLFKVNSGTGKMSFPATGQACYEAERQEGFFAIVGLANEDDTYFEERGVYPLVNGGNQGITATCMASLDDAGLYKALTSG